MFSPLASFCAAALVAFAALFGWYYSGTSDKPLSAEHLIAELDECHAKRETDPNCWNPLTKELLRGRIGSESMDIIAGHLTAGQCHFLGHAVGQEVYLRNRSIEKSIEECGIACGGACIHGAIGQAFIEEAGFVADDIDIQHLTGDDVRRYGKQLCTNADTCHGIGHILVQSYNDIWTPLEVCADIAQGIKRRSCYTGIFMENADTISSHNLLLGTRKKQVRDPENLLYPCEAVPQDAQHACLRYQARVQTETFKERGITKLTDMRPLRIAACETLADTKTRSDCFEGMGFNSYHLVWEDPDTAKRYCGLLPRPTDRAACYLGMTLWATNFLKTDESLSLCESVERIYERGVCYHGVFATLVADGWKEENLSRACEGHGERCEAGIETYLQDPWLTLYGLKI